LDVCEVAADELQTKVTLLNNAIDYKEFYPNVCCMCFQSRHHDVLEGGGAAWVSYKCGRWMHGCCIEDVVADNNSSQNFCSFCIDRYTV